MRSSTAWSQLSRAPTPDACGLMVLLYRRIAEDRAARETLRFLVAYGRRFPEPVDRHYDEIHAPPVVPLPLMQARDEHLPRRSIRCKIRLPAQTLSSLSVASCLFRGTGGTKTRPRIPPRPPDVGSSRAQARPMAHPAALRAPLTAAAEPGTARQLTRNHPDCSSSWHIRCICIPADSSFEFPPEVSATRQTLRIGCG